MRLLVDGGLPVAGGVIGAGGEISWPRPTRPGDVLRVVVHRREGHPLALPPRARHGHVPQRDPQPARRDRAGAGLQARGPPPPRDARSAPRVDKPRRAADSRRRGQTTGSQGGDTMHRRSFLTLAGTLLASALAAPAAMAQAYPERPITLIVPWGAGGGTDAVARIIATLMEKELEQPINVVNRTGGSGVVGHQASSPARARRLHHRHDHGRDRHDALAGPHRPQRHVVHADRAWSTPTPAGVQVRADSPYKNVERPARRDQGQPGQVQGLGHRPGRHLAPGDRRPAARPEGRPGRAALGADPTAPRPACRTWWPAASTSCRARCPRRAALIDAGKVKSARDHGRRTPAVAVSRTCRR